VRILMVPGIGGSDEGHWQSLWQEEFGTRADRIEPASWGAPDLDDWLAAVSRKVEPATVLVAHSLGCLAATAWLVQRGPATVIGAFLVSPPDPDGPAFPARARSFSAPRGQLPVPAVVVASRDDPFATIAVAREFARGWGPISSTWDLPGTSTVPVESERGKPAVHNCVAFSALCHPRRK